VDVSDCLGYPDFTCVALYGQMVVACAFMTPDVKVGEAYISFLVVQPHFAGAGLGKLMLYHLVQSCQGKDVTLHVSVDNPAMLLYQSFGFKAERYCLNFYDLYYPPSHPHSRHAYFMRLRR
jgi:ribosomal protein S18 acetylase RimI-like enzyme